MQLIFHDDLVDVRPFFSLAKNSIIDGNFIIAFGKKC